jgi:ribosomal protein S18 acetylase RimI-like enzyme
MRIVELDPSDPAALDRFRRVARSVYASDPVWAPAADVTLEQHWSAVTPQSHLLFNPLIVEESGRSIARAVAILKQNAQDAEGAPLGYVGFFECLPDRDDAAVAILEACETRLFHMGVRAVQAPKADNLLMGCQTGGFDLPHLCLTPHNPPYYAGYFDTSGYRPVQKVLTLRFRREMVRDRFQFSLPGFTTREFDRTELEKEIAIFHDLQPQVFSTHSGYVPRTLEEDRAMILGLLGQIDDELIIIAENDHSDAVGILVCIPDFYQSLSGLEVDRARILSIGIVPGYLRQGIGMLMANHLMRNLLNMRQYRSAEASLILADNIAPQELARRFGAEPGREFVVYQKLI